MTTSANLSNASVLIVNTTNGEIRQGDVFNLLPNGLYRCVTTDGRGTLYAQATQLRSIASSPEATTANVATVSGRATRTTANATPAAEVFTVRDYLAVSPTATTTTGLAVTNNSEIRKLMSYVAKQTFTFNAQYTFFDVANKKWKKARFERTSSDIGRATSGFALPANASESQKLNRLKRLNRVYGLALTATQISNSVRP